eukprot:5709162-Prymnesium_polylepis.2
MSAHDAAGPTSQITTLHGHTQAVAACTARLTQENFHARQHSLHLPLQCGRRVLRRRSYVRCHMSRGLESFRALGTN